MGPVYPEGHHHSPTSQGRRHEHTIRRNRSKRLEIDHAAAEFARIVGRKCLLDRCTGQDTGRKQVERHGAPQGLGAGQRRPIEQGRRVSVTQATHKGKAPGNDAQPAQPGQGERCIGVALARQVLSGQERRHLGRFTLGLGNELTAYDHGLECSAVFGRLCRSSRLLGDHHRSQSEKDRCRQQPFISDGIIVHFSKPSLA